MRRFDIACKMRSEYLRSKLAGGKFFTGFHDAPNGGLVNLRARYYDPSMGRFLNKDTWTGDANQPMSYNGWEYVYGNPVNLTDPSGQVPDCDGMRPEFNCVESEKINQSVDSLLNDPNYLSYADPIKKGKTLYLYFLKTPGLGMKILLEIIQSSHLTIWLF
jgi:RHS repeat-associated protein